MSARCLEFCPQQLLPETVELPKTHVALPFIDRNVYSETKPYDISGPLESAQEHLRTNLKIDNHKVGVKDVRGFEHCLNINNTGFEFALCPTKCSFAEEKIEAYLQETAEWVKQRLNATHSICFAYKYRNSAHEPYDAGVVTGSRQIPEIPAPLLHVDHTTSSGPSRIRRHLSQSNQERYLTGDFRVRTVTTWRPINGTVENFPLVLCNAYSVDPKRDLVAGDRVTPQGAGEVYYVAYNDSQEWFWLSDQTINEVAVFVSYDSQRDVGPACTYTSTIPRTTNNIV
jgi:hypothetical protein